MGLPLAPSIPLKPGQVRVRSLLAAVGAGAAWSCIVILIAANFLPSSTDVSASPIAVAGTVAFFAAVPLWLIMILEYLRERPSGHPFVWGLLLFSGPIFGPLLFYHLVWRKRYASEPMV